MNEKISHELSKKYIIRYMSSYSTKRKNKITLDEWLQAHQMVKKNIYVKKIYKNIMNSLVN
jgi:hypothetical protein